MYTLTATLHETDRILIYRALRDLDRLPVVLKVLTPQHRPRDMERLRHEYEITRAPEAPACAPVPLALLTFQGMLALVMKDVGANSLDRQLGSPMEVGTFLLLAIRIAAAVADIHRRHLVHRDLKPQNILCHPQTEEVWITGFGIATPIPCTREPAGAGRMIEGSLPYMAPEQTGRMNRTVDQRTDLYSIGITFYEMLTGRLPFQAADPMEWVHCHIAGTFFPVAQVLPAVPTAVSDIVARLLSKEAADRYQSARGLESDLRRCLEKWRACGAIDPFPLGIGDVPDRLHIPQKLYGREKEIAALLSAFDRVVEAGAPELVLVSGYSGIGKSSLVNELHRPIVRERGFFISGKFDQYKRDIPHATLVQAVQELVLEILAGSQEEVAAWQVQLKAALGKNGQLIVDVIPLVAVLIGPQPPVPALPSGDAQSRFHDVFRRFLGVFAQKQHPLAIFLDDLQWADPASLLLLQDLMTHPDMRHLLLVGAYRDNEVSPSHPLLQVLVEARRAGARISNIVLGPLSVEHIGALVADALHCERAPAAPLADLIEEKTAGNPFFVIQFITTLADEHLIEFDSRTATFCWDVARVREQGFTDNVVELMVGKLRRLPVSTQEALMLAACVGNTTSLATLAILQGRTQDDTQKEVEKAVREGLMLHSGDGYRFLHDRVQQAAHSLIPAADRGAVHLRIGRLLLDHLSPEQVEEGIFDLVNQLNLGAPLIEAPEEKERVARLNLIAGRKAKAATAYRSAVNFLSAGVALLASDCWEQTYALSFALSFERAECEFMSGGVDEAERLLGPLKEQAKRRIDKAAVYRVLVDLHVTKSENKEAITAALECLDLFSVHMMHHPGRAEVEKEYVRIQALLGPRSIEELIDLPLMTDPEVQAAMRLLSVLFAPAFFTDHNLLALHLCHMVNLSLRYGITDASTQGFAWFGVILGPMFHRYQDAYRFGRLACDLAEKHDFVAFKAKAYYSMELISIWQRPIKEAVDLIKTAFRIGAQTGDVTVTCYSCNHTLTDLILQGLPLGEVYRESQPLLDYVRRARFHDVADIIVSIQRFVQNLRGLTRSFSSFSGDDFDEEEFEAGLTQARMPTMVCWYYILKLQARFFSGDHEAAGAAARRAGELLWASLSHPQLLDYHYYGALLSAARHDRASVDDRAEILQTMGTHLRQLEEWAHNHAGTFYDKFALVSAEMARLRGQGEEAMRFYQEAILSARDNGFVQNEGLALELGSRFYRARGFDLIADAYLREARARYLRWGADGKVRQIDRQHPRLSVPEPPPSPAATFAAPVEQLDVLSVVKASQTISREIVHEKLVCTLLQVVLEQGGARRGYLLFNSGADVSIGAEAVRNKQGVSAKILPSLPLSAAPSISAAIVQYVRRTSDRVIIDDAASETRFATDVSLERAGARSVLCLPLLRQAEIVALLYLENDLLAGAFTDDRLALLELLASQAAISLENARLLSQEQQARAAAEEEIHVRDEFLSITSHELRTPMTSLLLAAQSLSSGLLPITPANVHNISTLLERQAIRLTGLINEMLAVGRIHLGRLDLRLEEVDLSEVVRDVVERLAPSLLQAGCEVDLRAQTPVIGRWAEDELGHVVTNLLSNALKFGAAKPIQISVDSAGGVARLVIIDHGIGIAPDAQARIFEKFARAVSSRSYGGLGLGLYIVRHLAQALGGSVRVESVPGTFTRFTVELPVKGPRPT